MQALRTRSDPVDTAVKTCLTRDHVSSLESSLGVGAR